MDNFSDFLSRKGCLWGIRHIAVFVFALIGIFADKNTALAWFILIGEVIELAIYILWHRGASEKRKKYNREDSYWSKKNTPEEHLKDESERDAGSIS